MSKLEASCRASKSQDLMLPWWWKKEFYMNLHVVKQTCINTCMYCIPDLLCHINMTSHKFCKLSFPIFTIRCYKIFHSSYIHDSKIILQPTINWEPHRCWKQPQKCHWCKSSKQTLQTRSELEKPNTLNNALSKKNNIKWTAHAGHKIWTHLIRMNSLHSCLFYLKAQPNHNLFVTE